MDRSWVECRLALFDLFELFDLEDRLLFLVPDDRLLILEVSSQGLWLLALRVLEELLDLPRLVRSFLRRR